MITLATSGLKMNSDGDSPLLIISLIFVPEICSLYSGAHGQTFGFVNVRHFLQ